MASVKVIPAVEARVHLGEIMKKSFKNGARFIIEKDGIPMVAIVSATEYNHVIQEREEKFKVFDKIRLKVPDISSDEVEKDIHEARQAIRKNRAQSRN
jgi:hypothetical protein